jgi:hypothetical protein
MRQRPSFASSLPSSIDIVADQVLDYERTLATLLGLIGQFVRVELSGAEPGDRAGAGFAGVLAHGREDVIVRVADGEEAINFTVTVWSDQSSNPWFIVGRSAFVTAVVVRSGLKPALTIRSGMMDITVTPDDA